MQASSTLGQSLEAMMTVGAIRSETGEKSQSYLVTKLLKLAPQQDEDGSENPEKNEYSNSNTQFGKSRKSDSTSEAKLKEQF